MRRLLIRPGAIGDSILGFPALKHLLADYTEVWVRSEIRPLVRFGDRVRAISETGLSMMEIDPPPGTAASLGEFDEIHSWYGANNPAFREAVQRFPFRFYGALPSATGVHAADFFASQVGAPVPAVPRIAISGKRHASIVVHPLSGSGRKNWPLDRFEALAARFDAQWAARGDRVRFAELDRLAEWLSGARLFIGNDSGITHLAAAVGTPVIALFGPTDPGVWAPRGAPVRILKASCMEAIPFDAVAAAVEEQLRQPGHAS